MYLSSFFAFRKPHLLCGIFPWFSLLACKLNELVLLKLKQLKQTKIGLMSKNFVNSFCFEPSDSNHDCPDACEYQSSPKQSYRQSAPKQNYCPNISEIAACKLLNPDFIARSKLASVGFVGTSISRCGWLY
jgi:hypothetical protein